jgi:AcrR family transcriptional regulator
MEIKIGRPPLVSREEIITAARDVFLKEGLTASIRDVAAVAGISEAAIFKRFSTKAALIVAAMAPPKPDIDALLAPLQNADLRIALTATMENIVSYFRELLPLTLPVAMQPDVGLAAYVDEVGDNPANSLHAALAAQLAAAANSGRLRKLQPFAVAGLIVATAHSLALFEIMGIHGGRSPPEVIANMTDVIWFGVEP